MIVPNLLISVQVLSEERLNFLLIVGYILGKQLYSTCRKNDEGLVRQCSDDSKPQYSYLESSVRPSGVDACLKKSKEVQGAIKDIIPRFEHLSFRVCGLFRYLRRYSTNAVLPAKAARTSAANDIPAMAPVSIPPSLWSITLLEDSTFGGIRVCRKVVSNDKGFSVTILLSATFPPPSFTKVWSNANVVFCVSVKFVNGATVAVLVFTLGVCLLFDDMSVILTTVHCIAGWGTSSVLLVSVVFVTESRRSSSASALMCWSSSDWGAAELSPLFAGKDNE
ncbi:hypothetical protein HW555_011989 [Spodoptera exigua]|uniref:Uncharacterized protein n=1 Tax=Spodoptera exigua TaxID=7107 RepID=A0A835KYC7_SPOEX|nr:hypothetical protein HW555_011989 [Spodoptera exigua]